MECGDRLQTGDIFPSFFGIIGFSVCLLRERVTVPKVIALLLSMAGVAGTAVASARVEPEPGGSNLLVPALTVVCAAALYALYEVSFTKLVSQGRSLKAYEVNLVCGLIGVAHIVFIPIFPLLDVLDIEKFILPTQAQWPLLLLNVCFVSFHDTCFVQALR